MTEQVNSRFRDIGNGVVVEMISNQTQIFYDPTTQAARAIFNGQSYMLVNGKYIQVGTENDILHVDFGDKLADRPSKPGDIDPITGADLSQISILGVMIIVKRAYDNYHNARAVAIAQRLAEEEAAQAAAQNPPAPPEPAPDPDPEGEPTPP